MPWGYAAVAVGGIVAGSMQADAAEEAANTQAGSTREGIAETRRQFDAVQQLLSPYVNGGNKSLGGQLDLAGLGAPGSQQAAIEALMKSPQFTAAQQLGESRILANASATGGLRGGNTQAALAQFNPALLSSIINEQYGRLGDITRFGQNAAAGVGSAGMATGGQVSDLLQQQGAALAGGQLAAGQAYGQIGNTISGLGGYYLANKKPAAAPDNFNYGAIGSGSISPGYSLPPGRF